MHFYPFNIGDYASHTKHLSLLEDLAYRRMLDLYYLNERPLSGCSTDVARSIGMRDNVDSVEYVLSEFFTLGDSGYEQVRVDREIAHYQDKAAKASAAGKASANKRATGSQQTLNGRSTDVQPNSRQETVNKEDKSLSPAKLPTCQTNEVISLYHSILPSLPAVRLQSDGRKKAIGTFWKWVLTSQKTDGTQRASNATEALEWIGAYFRRANENDFLMGRNPQAGAHANWRCDFDFLLTEKGKKHVIEKTLETT